MGAFPTLTLVRLMENQQAVIARDQAESDSFGAQRRQRRPVWKEHLTSPCLVWWDRSSGARSANREYTSPVRDAPVSLGGMLLPLGTDISTEDRILRVNQLNLGTRKFDLLIEGVFQIVAVLNQFTHIEVSVERTSTVA